MASHLGSNGSLHNSSLCRGAKKLSVALICVTTVAVLSGCGQGSPLGLFGELERALAAYSDSQEFYLQDQDAYIAAQAECDSAFVEYYEQLDAFSELKATLPQWPVRIINETGVAAYVSILVGIEPPAYPECNYGGVPIPDSVVSEPYFEAIANETVGVAAGGVGNGEIPCGEMIGISILAPIDLFLSLPVNNDSGFYLPGGNIAIEGIGSGSNSGFSGDTLAGARFVDPESADIDCNSTTLVIRITAPATSTVYETETGDIVRGAGPGAATISVE